MPRFEISRLWIVAAAAALLVGATHAQAVDGVREINETCATVTGCQSGDPPGYPVTIDQPGSYRLTSNLTPEDPDVNAVEVTAGGVLLDLGGFTIEGTLDCGGSGVPTGCVPSGGGIGVLAVGQSGQGLTIRNGVIRAMHGRGISISGKGARVEDVRLIGNGDAGTYFLNGGTVKDVTALRNVLQGIRVGGVGPCSISNCLAQDNAGHGIEADRCTIRGNAVYGNGGDGINIRLTGAIVIQNVVRANEGAGLNGTSGTGYVHNSFANNSLANPETSADVIGPAIQLGPNICVNALCP